jgi:RimJ/RimL family protein N-acetyltransferase
LDQLVAQPIITPRLELIPATIDLVQAELRAHEELGRRLGAAIPPNWPPELYDRAAAEYTIARLGEGAHQAGWWLHYMVLKSALPEARTVIGTCGFKGPPSHHGTVEIGYGMLAEFRRRGYAFEAVCALVAHVFARSEVSRVIAETLPELLPSIGLLEKAGFRCVGVGSEPGVVCYELRRADAHGFR